MKRIENATSRQVTFFKRRQGLLKKANELSVLCDAEVALIVFSPRGKLYEFANPASIQTLLERYGKCSEECNTTNTTERQDVQYLKREIANMEERIQILESRQRKILGEELESCALKDLDELESEVRRGLSLIRARKSEMLVDQIKQLERKEQILREENVFLRKGRGDFVYVDGSVLTTPPNGFASIEDSEVETQLVIRQPYRRQ